MSKGSLATRFIPVIGRIGSRSLSTSVAASGVAGSKEAPKIGGRPRRNIAPIEITQRAAVRIKELIAGKDDVVGVRLGVKRRGCNGYSYTMNYAEMSDIDTKKNEIVQDKDVTVLVENKAVFFIVGTVMDYQETELASEFTFVNPNIKGECGCGESFNV